MAPDAGDYERLRAMAIDVEPGDIGIEPDESGTAPWFAMIEFGFPEATVTIVAFEDGSTSLYASNGFGVIGGGAHDSVVEANRRFLAATGEALATFARR